MYYCAYAYTYPYFSQKWFLFVDLEKTNFDVYVRYKTSKGQIDWKNLFYDINSSHQNNRLAGNENTLLAFSNGLQYYPLSIDENKILSDTSSMIEYKIIRMNVERYLSLKEKEPISDLDIIIGRRSFTYPSYSFYHYYKH